MSMPGWPEDSVDGSTDTTCVASKSGVAPGGARSPATGAGVSLGHGSHPTTPRACSTASTAFGSTESGTIRLNCMTGPTATVKSVNAQQGDLRVSGPVEMAGWADAP